MDGSNPSIELKIVLKTLETFLLDLLVRGNISRTVYPPAAFTVHLSWSIVLALTGLMPGTQINTSSHQPRSTKCEGLMYWQQLRNTFRRLPVVWILSFHLNRFTKEIRIISSLQEFFNDTHSFERNRNYLNPSEV